MGGVDLPLNYFSQFFVARLVQNSSNNSSSIYGNAAVFIDY